jgi:DNA polymerase III epsilon subunit-like protein
LATDTQGYIGNASSQMDRTPEELTAVSWAAFCTNVLPHEDALFRIQALDSESLFDRLKLASTMLREKKNSLKAQMEKAGLKPNAEEGEDLDEQF